MSVCLPDKFKEGPFLKAEQYTYKFQIIRKSERSES